MIVSCEPARTRVVSMDPLYVTVEWPWGEMDRSSNFRWDENFSLPRSGVNPEWVPYLMKPAGSALRVGDECTISIPPTRLYVGHYEEYDPPRNMGWSPAPTAGIYVMPPENRDVEDAGAMLYVGGAEPIRVELVED